MSGPAENVLNPTRPGLPVLELLKPYTWFPPMWAFLCGIVSTGVETAGHWATIVAGVMLAGPLVCGTSQIVNDWYDRDVDAINQPDRPIPSGRVPGRRGLYLGIAWTLLSGAVAAALGPLVFVAAVIGLTLAWAYSAPPIRLKRNGWWGNTAVALSYEGLPWVTAAIVMLGTLPPAPVMWLALWYSIGAHGIMTLNDFKSVAGDSRTGVRSLPVQLGIPVAAWVACGFMLVAQLAVIVLLALYDRPLHAASVAALVVIQFSMMVRMLAQPAALDFWYNTKGVPLYVAGMLISAFAIRPA